RNSLKQNICVKMLQEGYHRSFSEVFSLLKSEQEWREAAEPGSALRLQTPLEEQSDKLETMRRHLNRAEEAERIGSWTRVCEQRLLLARCFTAPEDLWLSLHFYHSCADRKQGGRSRPATDARASMAELYLQQGELQQAMHQAELCVKQAEEGGWLDSTGRPLKLQACQTLWGIYNQLADAPLDAANYEEALKLLHKGYNIATECRWKQSACASGRLRPLRCQFIRNTPLLMDLVMRLFFCLQCQSLSSVHFLLIYVTSRSSVCLWLCVDQVLVGSARARCLIRKYRADVKSATPTALRRLVAWKDTRGCEEFSPDSTDPAAGTNSLSDNDPGEHQ
uniref:Tetratricopeptide repeat protein 29 n=1 Tax=Seriola lalandi dorsalis TaxID=1841481 RepID=A0A3B4WQB1_SERLL